MLYQPYSMYQIHHQCLIHLHENHCTGLDINLLFKLGGRALIDFKNYINNILRKLFYILCK